MIDLRYFEMYNFGIMPAPKHDFRTDAAEGSLYKNIFVIITATCVLASVQIPGASQNVLVQQVVIRNIYVSFSSPA